MGIENAGFSDPNGLDPRCPHEIENSKLKLQVSEEQKKADGYLAVLGAIRAVLILDQGDNMSPELREALWLDYDVAMDLQRVRREVVETAKALDQQYVKWADMGLAGLRMQEALTALAAVELARVEKGLPLETRIIDKRVCVHEWSGVSETTGMRVCLKCKATDWPHRTQTCVCGHPAVVVCPLHG